MKASKVISCLLTAFLLMGNLVAPTIVYAQVPSATATTVAPAAVTVPAPIPSVPAAKDSPGNVIFPWGEWVQMVLGYVQEIAITVALVMVPFLMKGMPGWVRILFSQNRINDLVDHAVRQAVAGVSGAVEGKQMSIPVTSDVVRQALVYMISHGEGVVADAAQSLPQLILKILARVPESANVPAAYNATKAVADVTPKSVIELAEKQDLGDVVRKYLSRVKATPKK